MTEPAISAPEPPVTKPSEQPKVKDPRRVAAGKRLAAISQQAKANKKAKREEAERRQEVYEEEDSKMFSLNKICMIFGLGISLGSLYLAWRSQRKDEVTEKSLVEEEEEVPTETVRDEPFDDLFD
ncbi:Hypothetical predicted protein [Paramuricea clavata]|uniref:Uncharacterized protein n=1 Tax=Paramuricea clavata TaxID=317549 RepID=A0A7D9I253_PARCT|nr:Hypothetical predicted protein [Paramuricea clavata]